MSKLEKDFENLTHEDKVVITPDDAMAAFEFWKQFDIPVMAGLSEAFDQFCKNPSVETQTNLKYLVCKAIATTDHECFTDDTFKKVAEECAECAYELGFEKDFENTVGEE